MIKLWVESMRKRRLRRGVRRAAAGESTPVIIFQMGKVASSTIEATLQPIAGLEVLRTHGLTKWEKVTAAPPARRDLESWLILHQLVRAGVPCKIVTVVREPIGRNLSAYFQNLDQLHGTENTHAKLSMAELIEGFFARYHHQKPLVWFDVEFNGALGVNVFRHPFNQERGWERLKTSQFDILILRTDLDDATKARALGEFVGTGHLSLVQKNVGESKSYSAIYQQFVRAIRLPESYVREMLEHPFTRHFFTPAQIEKMRTRWLIAGDA